MGLVSRCCPKAIANSTTLALAIDQAGAYISKRGFTLNLFKDHFDKHREKVMKEIPATLWEYTRKLKDAERETKLSVFTTWEISSELIDTKTPTGNIQVQHITLFAFFDNNDIFEDLFKKHFESERPEWMKLFSSEGSWDNYEFQGLVVQLANFSLISCLRITADGAQFSLHPLVQDWIKLRSNLGNRRLKTVEAIKVCDHYLGFGIDFKLEEIFLLHVSAVVQNEADLLDRNEGFESPLLMRVAGNFARFSKHNPG
jgi:hypothetical protein